MAAETLIVSKILEALKDRGAYALKIHGSAMQPKTIDILACYRGLFIGIEVKASKNKTPTPRQKYTAREIANAGGLAFVMWDASSVDIVLNQIDSKFNSLRVKSYE